MFAIAWHRYAFFGLLAVGAALRLVELVIGRGIHLDEAMLNLNLTERSFAGLSRPLDWAQGAPILFLWIEKLSILLLGDTEFALRLWPALMGIGALALFGEWAWKNLAPLEALAALAVLAIGRWPILYSALGKQYSTDLFMAVAMTLLIDRMRALPVSRPAYWGLLLAGAGAVWLSHPSVFVIAGVGGVYLVEALFRRDKSVLIRVGLFCAVSAAGFLLEYALLLRQLTNSDFLLDWWKSGFMPFPPRSVDDWLWFWERTRTNPRMFTTTITLNIVPPLLAAGVYVLYRRQRMFLALVVAPFLAALPASAAHQYPLHARLVLFLYPMLAVLLGVGAVAVARLLARWIPLKVAAAIMALALFLPQSLTVAKSLATSEREMDFRLVLNEVAEKFQPGDCLLVHEQAWPVFAYYRRDFGWDERTRCIVRYRSWRDQGRPEYRRLKDSPRAWFLFLHGKRQEWEALLSTQVGLRGDPLDQVTRDWGWAYLYELNPP